jgi:hypothetical protein
MGVDPKHGKRDPTEADHRPDDGERHAKTEHGSSVGAGTLAEGPRLVDLSALCEGVAVLVDRNDGSLLAT